MAKESLLVGGTDFAAAEVGDTVVYRPKSSRCGLGLGTQFTLLVLLAATGSLIQHPPSPTTLALQNTHGDGVSQFAQGQELNRTGAAPLLFGVLGSIAFSHMHRVLRRFCVRSPGVLRRARLFCDSCASTCWLLGCAAAETACGTYMRAGAGRTFADIYAASSYPMSHRAITGSDAGTKKHLELWTVVELIEHGLGGATADIAAHGTRHSGTGQMSLGSCSGPMIALADNEVEAHRDDFQQGGQVAITTTRAGWVTLAPLLVPSVLLPLLFAAVRCDAFSNDSVPIEGGSRTGPTRGMLQWCKRRGPSGLPRAVVVCVLVNAAVVSQQNLCAQVAASAMIQTH